MQVPVQPVEEKRSRSGDLFWALALVLALCTALVICARLPFFWALPELERAVCVGILALLLTPPIGLAVLRVWNRLSKAQSRKALIFLLVLVIAGSTIGALIHWPVRFPNTLHQIEVSYAGPAGTNVRVIEIRDGSGNAVSASDVQLYGNWSMYGNTFAAQGGQKASLAYQYYGPDEGSAQVLFERSPTAGTVQVRIDRTRQNINLYADSVDFAVAEAPLLGKSKTGSVLYLVWLVTLGLTLPVIVMAVTTTKPFTAPLAESAAAMFNGAQAVRHLVFVVVILLLLVQPLRGVVSFNSLEKSFWGRENLLRAFSEFRFGTLGDKIFTSVLVGKDSWLMFTGELSLDDFQNTQPLKDAHLELIRAKLDTLEERLSERGIKLLVVVPPNKNTVYSEMMPDYIPVIGDKSRLDQVIAYQQEHGNVQILDLRPALLDAKEKQAVYYSTDTHWNPYGAYIGYREILNTLRSDFPALRPHPIEEYQYVSRGASSGDTGTKLGQIRIAEEQFTLKPLYKRPTLSRWETTAKWSASILTTAQSDTTLPRLVMYRDSFAVELIPFLSDHFERAVYVLHFQVDENFIYSEQPDVVIIEITERYISSLSDLPIQP